MRLHLYFNDVEYELSPIHQGDGAALILIMSDEKTRRFLPQLCNLFELINGFPILICSFEKYLDDRTGFLLGIRHDYDLLGFIAVMDIPQCPSIFYAMHPKYRGKGIMKACVKEVLNYLSTNNMGTFVQTHVSPNNTASVALLSDLGFVLSERNAEDGKDIYVWNFNL